MSIVIKPVSLFPTRSGKYLPAWLLFLMLSPCGSFSYGGDKPIYLRADHITADQRTGQSTYQGNVRLKRGAFSFTADTAIVKQRNSQIVSLTASGNPIVARKNDHLDNILTTVKGQHLLYLAKPNKVIITGKVITRRGVDVIKSEKVTYKIDDNTVVAEGLGRSARVHALIQVNSLAAKEPNQKGPDQ